MVKKLHIKEEFYNDNTEEQELAEFLDWLKQEKIPVANVNKKFKMIHLQNPKDLDMASWYLHDRDYFKKLSDFGWMVGAPSPAGKKVAKALKMESMEFDGFTYSDADIVEALAYMYGISYEEVRKALKNNKFTDKEIKRAITYWNLDGYNPKEKQAEYNRRCKELGICENTEHTYRVWYRPYGLDGDEEDYIDVTASNEDEARRFARTCGNTTDVELLESKQLNEEEVQEFPNEVTVQINKYSDRSGTYVKSRIISNVVRIEDTDNYFYICTSDDYCYEYAKDSLYNGSYRYTILNLNESKQLNEDETTDIENALQNFINYNSNKNLDKIQKRIACTSEFDNGHVLHGDWMKVPVIDAELMAKEKSLENPDKVYYVAYDDIMVGSSDLQWQNGQFKTW